MPFNGFTIAGHGGNSADICENNGDHFANANWGIGEIKALPLSSPILPGCTATIEYAVGFNYVNVNTNAIISGDVFIWMSEEWPELANNNFGQPPLTLIQL